jgi:hypothetical protein
MKGSDTNVKKNRMHAKQFKRPFSFDVRTALAKQAVSEAFSIIIDQSAQLTQPNLFNSLRPSTRNKIIGTIPQSTPKGS